MGLWTMRHVTCRVRHGQRTAPDCTRCVVGGLCSRRFFFEKVLYVHRTRNRLITPVSITKMIIASM